MHNPITQQHAEKLLDGTTKGPWTTFNEEWEEEVGNDTFMCGQHGIIGDRDGILDTRPVRSLMDAPDQWDETGEHNNAANVALAAASPDLAHTVIWLWKQNQQQQAQIERLQTGFKAALEEVNDLSEETYNHMAGPFRPVTPHDYGLEQRDME